MPITALQQQMPYPSIQYSLLHKEKLQKANVFSGTTDGNDLSADQKVKKAAASGTIVDEHWPTPLIQQEYQGRTSLRRDKGDIRSVW